MSTDIVGSVSSGLPRTYLMLLLRLAYSHHVTVTLRRTLVGVSPHVRWLLYFSPVVIRWPAGTLARPLGSILPALNRSKVYALFRTMDAMDFRGGTAFAVPLGLHCQHCASLSNPFFKIPKNFFRNLAGHGARPWQDGFHPAQVLYGRNRRAWQVFFSNFLTFLSSIISGTYLHAQNLFQKFNDSS